MIQMTANNPPLIPASHFKSPAVRFAISSTKIIVAKANTRVAIINQRFDGVDKTLKNAAKPGTKIPIIMATITQFNVQ